MIGFPLFRVPIFSDFKEVSSEIHLESLKELLVTFIVSTLPIWSAVLIIILNDPSIGFPEAFYKELSNGELILYASTMLGPVIYIALKERGGKMFPGRITHMMSVIIIVILSTIVFVTQRVDYVVNKDFVFNLSVVAYFFSFFFYIAQQF